MKWKIKFLIIISASIIYADKIVIVANKNFPINYLDKKIIQKIYLDQIRVLKDKKVIPINLPYNHPLRKVFEKKVLNLKRFELQRYWIKAHYLGHRPPKVFNTQKTVIAFLKNVIGAIGYVEKEYAKKSELKILYEVEK